VASRDFTFGIIGGYGSTGRAVAAEILKSGGGPLLIGGRDPAKLESVAAEFGGRASAARVDVYDGASLAELCNRCSVIVNCAGPVMALRDRVAQAAFRARCHYVDAAGMGIVRESLLRQDQEIAAAALSFVISAGWMPGLTELLPVYAYRHAKATMESIESVAVYFTDSGDWSSNALQDGVFFLRQAGFRRPSYCRRGEPVHAKTSEASPKVDLGPPIGVRRFSLISTPELDEVGCRLSDCDFLSYSYLSGFRTVLAWSMIAFLPLSEGAAVRQLRGIFRRNRLPLAGFVEARAIGRAEGRSAVFKTRIAFDEGRDYWMNAVALATVARLVSARKDVQTGVHYLSAALDSTTLMRELRAAGVQQAESFDFCK
jgi:hypothetical protein